MDDTDIDDAPKMTEEQGLALVIVIAFIVACILSAFVGDALVYKKLYLQEHPCNGRQ